MKSNKTRVFTYNRRKVVFDKMQFTMAFNNYRNTNQIPVMKLEEDISNELFLTREAIHNWRNGYNGPSDLKTVEMLAAFFRIPSDSLLSDYREERNSMGNYSDEQIDSVKKLTDGLWTYIFMFNITEGFTVHVDIDTGEQSFLDAGANYQDEFYDKLVGLFRKEYFSLHGTKVYDELEALLNDISSSYDEEYRFLSELDLDNKEMTTYCKYVHKWEDRLTAIIDTSLGYLNDANRGGLSTRQRVAFRHMYEAIIACIDDIKKMKFNELTDHLMAFSFRMDELTYTLKQEGFDLRCHEIYYDLDEILNQLSRFCDTVRLGDVSDVAASETDVVRQLYALVNQYN